MWKKIWEWLKKYGGYIAAFAAGIASYLFIDSGGDKRTKQHIASITARLGEYENLVKRLNNNIRELEGTIGSLEGTSGELRAKNDELRDLLDSSKRDVESAGKSLGELRQGLTEAEGDIDKLGDIDKQLSRESERIDEGFGKLAEFIEKYGKEA